MSYGLRVKNPAGDILIDSFGHTMLLFETYESSASNGNPATILFTALIYRPLVVITPYNKCQFKYRVWKSSANWDRATVSVEAPTTVSFKVWIFSRSEAPLNADYGFRLRDSTGRILAVSDKNMLREHAIFSGDISRGTSLNLSFTALPYKPPFTINMHKAFWWNGSCIGTLTFGYLRSVVLTDRVTIYYDVSGEKYMSPGNLPASFSYTVYVYKYL